MSFRFAGREGIPPKAHPVGAPYFRDEADKKSTLAGVGGAQHRASGGVRLQRFSGAIGVFVCFFVCLFP